MHTLLLALTLSTQGVPLAPALPVGVGEACAANYHAVVAALERGDFSGARRHMALMPRLALTYSWDDAAVPAERNAEYRSAIARAHQAWTVGLPSLTLTSAPNADVRVSFVESLPPPEEGALPAGAAFFLPRDPSEPFVEAVIALKRMPDGRSTEVQDVANEFAFAIGAFLGLAPSPPGGGAMGRYDGMHAMPPMGGPLEFRTVRKLLSAVEALSKAIANKQRLRLPAPSASLQPLRLEHPPVLQGDPATFDLTLSNPGPAPLDVRILPTSGAIQIAAPTSIAPHASALVRVSLATKPQAGPIRAALYVYTNDPEQTLRVVPIECVIDPLYRILRAERGSIVEATGEDVETSVFVAINPSKPLQVTSVQLFGVPGEASFQPWEGTLADFELAAPPAPRKGYEVTVRLKAPPLGAFVDATVVASTDAPGFELITRTLRVQSGIVAHPSMLDWAELGREPRNSWILLERATDFRVLSVESNHPHLAASLSPIAFTGKRRIDVRYLGAADPGVLEASVTIRTDSERQPTLTIPVRAIIR